MLIKKLLFVALSDFVKIKQLKMKLCQMQMHGLAKAKMSVLDRRKKMSAVLADCLLSIVL